MKRADVERLLQRMRNATAELAGTRQDFQLRVAGGPDWEGELGAEAREPEPLAPPGKAPGPRSPYLKQSTWKRRTR